jgi:hypothetical protein
MRPTVKCFKVILDYLKHLFLKSNFLWWHARRCSPQHVAVHLLALSALATGIARANAGVSNKESPRAIFDSDSFEILVNGGATACISNHLSDFTRPPMTSMIRVKGFNGTTSSTRVGTVRWSLLDGSGQRRTLEVKNTYYVPACRL